jgi:prepilin-type N-terminal cleavage/methylation domain-containing protein/prepilin-type processing-associated H-X9-DG protein
MNLSLWNHGRNHADASGCRSGHRSGKGFTLVELLVVIGIISVLIGILLPALNRARESARSAKCLNNMRQITIAAISFAGEHRGWMVGRGGAGILRINSSSGKPEGGGTVDDAPSGDWIAWLRQVDPITGVDSGDAKRNQNITYSALAPYMSVKTIVHKTPKEANTVAERLDEVFRCPSDNLMQRNKWQQDPSKPRYNYSYAMNDLFLCPVQPADKTDYPSVPANMPDDQRNGFRFSGKISSIRASSEKVLLVCQDEQTIDDGVFKANSAKWAGNVGDHVAARHESKFRGAKATTSDTTKNVNARGNVGFADGHVEFLSRKDAISQRYSGHPLPDPPGF